GASRDELARRIGHPSPFLDVSTLEAAVPRVVVIEDPHIVFVAAALEQDAVQRTLVGRPAGAAACSLVLDPLGPAAQVSAHVVEVGDVEDGGPGRGGRGVVKGGQLAEWKGVAR